METQKFKLQYFSRMARYLHSVKSVDTPAIGTFISASLAKMTLDPLSPQGESSIVCNDFLPSQLNFYPPQLGVPPAFFDLQPLQLWMQILVFDYW